MPAAPPVHTLAGDQLRAAPSWMYKDEDGGVQGPFPTGTMRSWAIAGYFENHTLICPHGVPKGTASPGFLTIADVFGSAAVAFV